MLFSIQIVAYLFLGGTAGGLLLGSCLWSLRFHSINKAQAGHDSIAFETFFSRCTLIGSLAMLASILCLFWDLGRPERILYLFLSRSPNILTLGAVALGLSLLLALALWVSSMRPSLLKPKMRGALEIICIIVSCVVIAYTGVYLYSLESVAFWHTPALIVVFFFSSISAGISTMLLVAYFAGSRIQLLEMVKPLQIMHVVFILCEALAIAWFLWVSIHNPSAAQSMLLLTSEKVLPTAIIGVGIMALAIPLALETASVATKHYRNIPACDVICIVGGFFLRYCIVICGLH